VSSGTLAAAKRAGENAEHEVFDEVEQLEPASDQEHHDAVATTAVFPRQKLPFVGMCALEAGALVEIKSTMAVQTTVQRRGRFKLRQTQHEALLEAGGAYLFVVCQPRPAREAIAMKVVPATIVDHVVDAVASWRDERDGRGRKTQIAWSRIFDPPEVE
jgi:hypothetical protein